MAMADMKVWAHRLMTPHTPPLQRPREPARVQRCEAAEPLPGEFQLCAPRKPAVLSLVPGAVGEKLTLETSAMGGGRTFPSDFVSKADILPR